MRYSGKKSQESISNFIEKTYNILENQQNSDIIAWTPRGQSFIIKDIKKFQQQILPIYFKHSNFSSFVRQLNMYSFHKVRGDKLDCQFEHEKFKKGYRQLLSKIRRKQSQSYIMSHQIIEQGQGNQSMGDSSENIKKQSDVAINLDLLDKQSNKIENYQRNQGSFEELEVLRRENKALRAIKLNKLQKHKMLSSSNPFSIGEKFFKLTTCLLAQKIRKQLKIQAKLSNQTEEQWLKKFSFDQVIEHVLNNTYPPLEFCKYSSTAKTISSQQSDFDFMIGKANNNSMFSNGFTQIRVGNGLGSQESL